MHLFLMTRGIKTYRDLWVSQMQAQAYPWTRKNLQTGKNETVQVQGSLRPIELWEYVFPEEHLTEVLTCMGYKNNEDLGDWGGGYAKYALPVLRKALGAKKIPEFTPSKITRWMQSPNFGANVIGYKEDVTKEFPQWGYEQEAL